MHSKSLGNSLTVFLILSVLVAIFRPTQVAAAVYSVEYSYLQNNAYYDTRTGAPYTEAESFTNSTGVAMDYASSASFSRYGADKGSSYVHSEGYSHGSAIGVGGEVSATATTSDKTTAQLNSAAASMVFDDLIITRLDDPSATGYVNNVSMTVHVSGTLMNTTDYQNYSIRRHWRGSWTINGTAGSGSGSGVFSGISDPYNINGTFDLALGQATLGQATTFGLAQVLAITALARNETVNNSGDFMSTATFVTGSPVFVLPEGYTANSVSAGIVNNVYVPTPEPASVGLFLLGGLALLPRRRR